MKKKILSMLAAFVFISASNEPSGCLRDAEHLQTFGDCREGQKPRPLGRFKLMLR